MSGIFKAYDIRGSYPEDLDEPTAEKIGAAFAALLGPGPIAVGRDVRPSSPALAASFIRGFTGAGGSVTDFGLSSSPFLYYAIIRGKFHGGAMITASHLPPHENGIKLCRENAIPLSGEKGLPALERMVHELPGRSTQPADHRITGSYGKGDLAASYIDAVAALVRDPRPLAIVADAGDGMAGPEVRRFFPKFPSLAAVVMHAEPDGRFSHHGPNPFLPRATTELEEAVRKSGADFGVAFDGDADRCIFIDDRGGRVPADLVTALVAGHYLSREPGSTILYDLRSSRVVAETVTALGGRAVRCRVGHAFIKEQMRHENALFAGELSGHYYFRDMGFCDNGLAAMVQMINLLSAQEKPLSELIRPLRKYASTGEVNIRVGNPETVMAAIRNAFSDATIDLLDGLTIEYPSWWFNLRPSNTEPLIRLNLEAGTEAAMERKKEEVLQVIRDADPSMAIESG
jgi:phosphomannomutase